MNVFRIFENFSFLRNLNCQKNTPRLKMVITRKPMFGVNNPNLWEIQKKIGNMFLKQLPEFFMFF